LKKQTYPAHFLTDFISNSCKKLKYNKNFLRAEPDMTKNATGLAVLFSWYENCRVIKPTCFFSKIVRVEKIASLDSKNLITV
jgi:hypothetical protein